MWKDTLAASQGTFRAAHRKGGSGRERARRRPAPATTAPLTGGGKGTPHRTCHSSSAGRPAAMRARICSTHVS
eukprot:233586-Chlamydomonas_euryale.AAC.2